MIRIDGSAGEGGGQMLRTSLSLSLVTGQPFAMDNIRAGRERPGLLRQHLTAVMAAAEISDARVEGAALASKSLVFAPGKVRPGEYQFVVGTAGSATLVFQTVLPALMLADGESAIAIEGGTHNSAAPPYHFLDRVFRPLVERMGPRIELTLERHGFYPAGGGRFRARITPVRTLAPLRIENRGEITSRRVTAIAANLPGHIARREVDMAVELLGWGREDWTIEPARMPVGPGNVVMVEVGDGSVSALFTAFGRQGVPAEKVAAEAVKEAREYLASTAAADEHLADQLLLPMALAGAGSFTAVRLDSHARTNMDVIARFLRVRFDVAEAGGAVRVEVTRER